MTQSPRDSRRRSGERAAVIAMFFTPALARASARESFLTDASTTGAPVPRTKQGTWSSITTGPSADAARRDASKRWPPAPPSQKKARPRPAKATGRQSAMFKLAGGKMEAVTSERSGRPYAGADCLARESLLETVEVLTICLGNMG